MRNQLAMRNQVLLPLALAAAMGCVVVPTAHAQSGRISAVGNRETSTNYILYYDTSTMQGQPLSIQECEDNVDITVSFAGLTTSASVAAIWTATSSSAGCDGATQRQPTTAIQCTQIAGYSQSLTTPASDITVPVRTLFRLDSAADCTTATDLSQYVWFLPLPSASDTGTASVGYVVARIDLDRVPPSAPTIPTGNYAGNNNITIDVTSTSDVNEFRAYFDPTACESGVPPTTFNQTTLASDINTGSSVTFSATEAGIAAFGGYAAVAVVAVDHAGNESEVSNAVCVQRVEIEGFWEAYCRQEGREDVDECAEYYSCAARPGRSSSFVAGASLLFGFGLLLARRRSQS